MIRSLIVAVAALSTAIFTTTAHAQTLNRLATQEVSLNNTTATIDMTKSRGQVQALRLFARKQPIVINNIEVLYSDGSVHNERREINMLAGERTRPIDPRNAGKFVDQITITFNRNRAAPEPVTIEVWGLQTAAMRIAQRPVAPPSARAEPQRGSLSATPTSSTITPANPGQQAPGGEVLFGSKLVDFGIDRDVITVGPQIGKFTTLALRVLDNDIFINSLRVVYANGETDEIAYNAAIPKDSQTRWLNLRADQFIKEIQLLYRTRMNFRGKAYVEVIGQYAPGWYGPSGEYLKYNEGFVLLGGQSAGFTIDRNDVIRVGRNDGGFRRLQVRVRDHAITLFEVRVVYGNGEVDIIPANRTRVDAGSTFGPIELKGGTRIINEIRPTYRTRIFQQGGVARGRAVVEFWAQK